MSLALFAAARIKRTLARLLSRFTRSPAGIYTFGSGYLQTPANLNTWSQDFTNGGYQNASPNTPTIASNAAISPSGLFDATLATAAVGGTGSQLRKVTASGTTGAFTSAFIVSGGTSTRSRIGLYDQTSAFLTLGVADFSWSAGVPAVYGSPTGTITIAPAGGGFYLVALSASTAVASAAIGIALNPDCALGTGNVLVHRAGLFSGTFTASQLAAMGGIPWTRETASVSLSLGPEKVTNGTFESADGWTLGTGWAISGGTLVASAATGIASRTLSLDGGKDYLLTANNNCSVQLRILGGTGQSLGYFSENVSTKFTYSAGAGTTFQIVANGTTSGVSDNISVRELISTPCPVYTDAHAYLPGIGTISGLPTENYTSSTGDTGYSAVDGVVGLALDGLGTVGAEKMTGPYLTAAYWTTYVAGPTFDGAAIRMFAISDRCAAPTVFTAGSTYRATVVFTATGGAGLSIDDDGSGGGVGSLTNYVADLKASGTFVFKATASNRFRLLQSAAGTVTVTSLSFKEITGIHCTQATTANKPKLSARVNLLTYTEALNNTLGWAKTVAGTGTTPIVTDAYTGAADPNGTFTASRLQASIAGTTSGDISGLQTGSGATVASRLGRVWLKSNTGATQSAWFRGGGAERTLSITTAWTEVTDTGTLDYFSIGKRGTFGGSGSLDILVWHPDLRPAATPASFPAYQAVRTASDYDTAGFPWYWSFDGSNDSLALGSVPFQMADDHCVIAAVNYSSGVSGTRSVFSIRSTASANPIVAQLYIDAGYAAAAWRDDAVTLVLIKSATLANGRFVMAARQVGNTRQLWVDGVMVATNTTALGTTTPTSAAVGVVPTATPSGYLSGDIYSVLPIKGTLTDADLIAQMRIAGQIAGITI